MSAREYIALLLLGLVVGLFPVCAQDPPGPDSKPVDSEAEMIQLRFRGQTELQTLVQFVSSTLQLNIHYDQSVARKQVTILSPERIPRESLMGLLQSVLRMSELAIVDSQQPGWKKIVPLQDVPGQVDLVPATAEVDSARVVAKVFRLEHINPETAAKTIDQALKRTGGNTFAVPDQPLLIVSDFAANLDRIERMIQMIDQPGSRAVVEMVPLEHTNAAELSKKLQELLQQRGQALGQAGRQRGTIVNHDQRSNRLILVSSGPIPPETLTLIRELDVPAQTVTRRYLLKHVPPARIENILLQMLEKDSAEYKSAIDEQSGLWLVTALPWVHEQIEAIRTQIDRPETLEETGHIRFYRLRNTTAGEVLATIQALDGEGGIARLAATDPEHLRKNGQDGPRRDTSRTEEEGLASRLIQKVPTGQVNPPLSAQPAGPDLTRQTARTRDAVITADPNTNSLIVVAPAPIQKVYQHLIEMLDKRRPQVMIEVTLVTLDTTDGFSLGVEISGSNNPGGTDSSFLSFSAFGLSEMALDTGVPTIKPGVGFNGVLIDEGTINVVLRALASNTRARILSVPKVLVNDNAAATLQSVSEFPYSSVNASDTIATTSFGGYASAGTTINVTPHISEDDYLQLKYTVSLNSFGEQETSDLPPPRQSNSISSEITVPDGHAVIVGGLSRQDVSRTTSKLPWLGDIPLLEYLLSNRSNNDSQSTLFVFIRPVILRADTFEDLKYLSEKDLAAAELPSNYPPSRPMMME